MTTKASQGKHPNIVAFLGAVFKFPSIKEQQQDWAIGLVFELCDPYDCYHLLHSHKIKLTVEQKLRLVCESAAGLAYLHSLNIIHRDFGSRNLLIKDGHIKLTDFGLARKMQDGNQFYQPSSVAGTLPWMAPEQVHSYFAYSVFAQYTSTQRARTHTHTLTHLFSWRLHENMLVEHRYIYSLNTCA